MADTRNASPLLGIRQRLLGFTFLEGIFPVRMTNN